MLAASPGVGSSSADIATAIALSTAICRSKACFFSNAADRARAFTSCGDNGGGQASTGGGGASVTLEEKGRRALEGRQAVRHPRFEFRPSEPLVRTRLSHHPSLAPGPISTALCEL